MNKKMKFITSLFLSLLLIVSTSDSNAQTKVATQDTLVKALKSWFSLDETKAQEMASVIKENRWRADSVKNDKRFDTSQKQKLLSYYAVLTQQRIASLLSLEQQGRFNNILARNAKGKVSKASLSKQSRTEKAKRFPQPLQGGILKAVNSVEVN